MNQQSDDGLALQGGREGRRWDGSIEKGAAAHIDVDAWTALLGLVHAIDACERTIRRARIAEFKRLAAIGRLLLLRRGRRRKRWWRRAALQAPGLLELEVVVLCAFRVVIAAHVREDGVARVARVEPQVACSTGLTLAALVSSGALRRQRHALSEVSNRGELRVVNARRLICR